MAQDFKENAHLKTDMKNFGPNHDHIFKKKRYLLSHDGSDGLWVEHLSEGEFKKMYGDNIEVMDVTGMERYEEAFLNQGSV